MLSAHPMSARLAASDIGRARRGTRRSSDSRPSERRWAEPVSGIAAARRGSTSTRLTPPARPATRSGVGRSLTSRASWTSFGRRGVSFEEYDFGEMRTENGLLSAPGGYKAAWFKDSEGNTLELTEVPQGG